MPFGQQIHHAVDHGGRFTGPGRRLDQDGRLQVVLDRIPLGLIDK